MWTTQSCFLTYIITRALSSFPNLIWYENIWQYQMIRTVFIQVFNQKYISRWWEDFVRQLQNQTLPFWITLSKTGQLRLIVFRVGYTVMSNWLVQLFCLYVCSNWIHKTIKKNINTFFFNVCCTSFILWTFLCLRRAYFQPTKCDMVNGHVVHQLLLTEVF